MKNLMNTKHVVATLAIAFFTVINAFGQKPNTFFITADDQKHYIYGDEIAFWRGSFTYVGENGKKVEKKTNDVKLLYTGTKIYYGFLSQKVKENNNLKEIVAFNKDYILVQYPYTEYDEWFIYKRDDLSMQLLIDEDGKKKAKAIEFYYRYAASKKKNKKIIPANMSLYFPECPELIEKQLANNEEGYPINSGISYYNCGNAPDFFTNEVEEKAPNKTEENEKEPEQFIMTNEGEKIKAAAFYREPQNIAVQYYEKLGATAMSGIKVINTSKIKYIVVGDELYLPLNNKNGKLSMMEIVAYSSKKVLAYDHSKSTYNVYDRNNKLLVGEIKKEDILPLVQDHFADCKDVVNHVEEAAKLHRDPKNGMANYNCNNAPKLIAE